MSKKGKENEKRKKKEENFYPRDTHPMQLFSCSILVQFPLYFPGDAGSFDFSDSLRSNGHIPH